MIRSISLYCPSVFWFWPGSNAAALARDSGSSAVIRILADSLHCRERPLDEQARVLAVLRAPNRLLSAPLPWATSSSSTRRRVDILLSRSADPALSVIEAIGPKASPRIKQVMPILIKHLHAAIVEADISMEEWLLVRRRGKGKC